MSISQSLSNANSGLAAASAMARTTSSNIANALTEGYARREVSLAERVVGSAGAGVMVAGVLRATANAVTAEWRGADSAAAMTAEEAEAAARISALMGGPEDPNALFAKVAAFDTALRTLANSPENASLQSGVVAAAKDMASSINRIADTLQTIRLEADGEIAARVSAVNDALKEIETLNVSIARGGVSGADTSALEDRRKLLVDTVNRNIPVRTLARDNGAIDLMTPEGVFLLAGEARSVEFAPAAAMAPVSAYANGAGTLSGISVDGVDITPGGLSSQQPSSGALAGLFSVRDSLAPDAAAGLDALAGDIALRFSQAGLDPTLPTGAPGLFTDGGGAFDPANTTGFAARIDLNAAVDPATGGAAFRIRDGLGAIIPGPQGTDAFVRALISALNDGAPAPVAIGGGEGGALDFAARVTSNAAATRSRLEAADAGASVYASGLKEAETAATGVDTDAELQRLLLIEQAYAANARVIETVDAMMDRLLAI